MQDHEETIGHEPAAGAPGGVPCRRFARSASERQDNSCRERLQALFRCRAAARPGAPGPRVGARACREAPCRDRRSADLARAVPASARGDRRGSPAQRTLPPARLRLAPPDAGGVRVAGRTPGGGGADAGVAGASCARSRLRVSGFRAVSPTAASSVEAGSRPGTGIMRR